MVKKSISHQQVPDEASALQNRLEETEETLRAIRQYMVDAFVITREDGTQVVTLSDAEFPYRLMVEAINEGAVTLIPDGTIFYVNPCFARMVQIEGSKLIGVRFHELVSPEQQERFDWIFKQATHTGTRGEFLLQTTQGDSLPVQLSLQRLGTEGSIGTSIIATDITERIRSEEKIRALAADLTLAEQEERHRISQVLHDDLQQRLFAIKAQLSFLKLTGEGDKNSSEAQLTLDQVQTWVSDAITITRNLSVDMSPAVLQGEGLSDAVVWLSARMKDQYGLQLQIEAKDNLNQLNTHMRVLLFQAIRELLFNVVKHSGTQKAFIKLERSKGQGRITVNDLGQGFDTSTFMIDPIGAHGLLLIRDRLSLMHGSMSVESTPGKGTVVVIEFPMEENLG
jgi:PAS domain S-box-containing protein